MHVSEVSICNQALSWLGADLITSLDFNTDNSTEAKICNANYEFLRDAVIEEREWTFATERFSLPKMARPPAYGYGSQFLLPSHVIRVLSIPSSTGGVLGLDGGAVDWAPDAEYWKIESQPEGRVILVDRDGPLFMRGIIRVTESRFFSPTFVQALAARIAADNAMALTEDRQKESDMWALYDKKMGIAATMDGMQGRSMIVRSNHLTRVR